MKNLTQELYEKIKAGEAVDTTSIQGYINTPEIPDDVFTIVKNAKGEEFKRYIEAGKWISWINSVADKTQDTEAPIEEKAIVGTHFYKQCEFSYREIQRNEFNGLSGTRWLCNGALYSISIQGKEIQDATVALKRIAECAIVPVSNNIAEKEADAVHTRERQQDIIEYVNGRC